MNPAQHSDRDIRWQEISLTQKRDVSSVHYLSALPQQLARQHPLQKELTLAEISQQIVQWLNLVREEHPPNGLCDLAHKSLNSGLSCRLWAEFKIETQRPGWIAFCLSSRGLGLWLQYAQQSLHPSQDRPSENSSDHLRLDRQWPLQAETAAAIWRMQYTHARCCTLLKLWQETQPGQSRRALTGADGRNDPPTDPPALPDLIWLTDTCQLRLSTPQAYQLIQALISLADDMVWVSLECPERRRALLLKRAAQLCQAFDEFYRGCLYGFSQFSTAAPSKILQLKARFGLVAVTRNLLKVLLEHYLKVPSPTSL